jgi:F0F1-type ATP synthase epsilon subunit
VLQTGLLKKRDNNSWVPLILWGGVAQIENNEITVLANGVEEFSEQTMTREEADKKVLTLLQEIETLKQNESETSSISKLMLEAEIAKARVEGLSLIN